MASRCVFLMDSPEVPVIVLLLALGCSGPDPIPWGDLPESVVGVPNLDDDDRDGERDREQDVASVADEDDLARLVIPGSLAATAVEESVTVELTDAADLQVLRGGQVVLSEAGDSLTLSPDDGDVALDLHFLDYGAGGTLRLVAEGPDGPEEREVDLSAAPLRLTHHLQPAEHLYVMQVNDISNSYSNLDMVADLKEIVGEDHITILSPFAFDWDVWVQDEVELGHFVGDDTHMELALDSIRMTGGQGLDDFPEKKLEGPGMALDTYGRPRAVTSLDSFGNLETTPPVEGYPHGRIYFGGGEQRYPSEELRAFLESETDQAPLKPDTSWLCVGHVDEFMSFVPDSTAPRGFRFLVTDQATAYAFLEGLDRSWAIPKYQQHHGYSTVGELLDDDALRAFNEDLQADYVDAAVDLFRDEIGLMDEEIVRLPLLFEANGLCGGMALALMPGMVNLTVYQPEGEAAKLLIPDPFFRSDLADQGSDPLIAAFDALMPDEVETHYLDDWDVYHEGMGEVHCGTNVRRAPPEVD